VPSANVLRHYKPDAAHVVRKRFGKYRHFERFSERESTE